MNSRSPGSLGSEPVSPSGRTPGPLGHNDAADPSASRPFGDTPGPLGVNDHAVPWAVAFHLARVDRARLARTMASFLGDITPISAPVMTGGGSNKPAASGSIDPKFHRTFTTRKLSETNCNNAFKCMESTATGKKVTDYLRATSVKVTLYYMGIPADLEPVAGQPTVGYCHPVSRGKEYEVYVAAGLVYSVREYRCPNRHSWTKGGLEGGRCPKCNQEPYLDTMLKDAVTDMNQKEIATILFHELLHAAFTTQYSESEGTGHEGGDAEVIDLSGNKAYDEKTYDSRFLKALKDFDKEIKDANCK